MMEKGIVVTDTAGYYRLKPIEAKNNKAKRWVSPAIAKILKKGGKVFSNVTVLDEPDDSYYMAL